MVGPLLQDGSYHNAINRDFDPSSRKFSRDELRPQPIIKKKRKASLYFHLNSVEIHYNFKTDKFLCKIKAERKKPYN